MFYLKMKNKINFVVKLKIFLILLLFFIFFINFVSATEFTYTGIQHNISVQVADLQATYFWNNTWYAGSSTEGRVYEYYTNWSYKNIYHSVSVQYPQAIMNNGTDFILLSSSGTVGIRVYGLDWGYKYAKTLSEATGWHSFVNNGTNYIITQANRAWSYNMSFGNGTLIGNITPASFGPCSIEGIELYNGYYYIGASCTGSWIFKLYSNFSYTGSAYNVTAQAKGQIQNILNNGTTWFVGACGYLNNEVDPNVFEYTTSIDTSPPNIVIVSPLNQTYNSITSIFNITVTDESVIDTCIYSLDYGITNFTMSNYTMNQFNASNTSMSLGANTASFYCNDSLGYLNNSEKITFGIDFCAYPSIGNWEIDLSNYCVITTNYNVTGNISFAGIGNITFNSNINATHIGALPANQRGYVGSNARINIKI